MKESVVVSLRETEFPLAEREGYTNRLAAFVQHRYRAIDDMITSGEWRT